MSYRPICDVWLLARPKLSGGRRYYGSYPSGFLLRARALLGVHASEPVLHVCGGMVRYHVFSGFGVNDRTVDIDRRLKPDFVMDVRRELPALAGGWPAIMADPPYTPEDAAHYKSGAAKFPEPRALLARCLDHVRPGGRVALLHYEVPSPPPGRKARFIACVGVLCGFNNRMRAYSVYQREA